MKVSSKIGDSYIPYFSPIYWGAVFGSFFIPHRCSMCSDKSNKLSDISMADAWNMKCVTEDKNGTSLLVSRNEFSEKFLLDHGLNKEVKIENIPKDFILESQGLYNNKKNIDTRVKLLKKFGYNTQITMNN